MCREPYDITLGDLNPRFLFSCIVKRTEDETNYHSHDFVELVVILKGEGKFVIDGKEVPVREGNLLILNPGTHHRSLVQPQAACPASECYLAFSGVEFRDCPPGALPLFADGSAILRMPDKMRQEVFRLCAAVEKEVEASRPGRYFMLKAYLIQLICLLIRERQIEKEQKAGAGQNGQRYIFKSASKKYVVERIMEYLENHYREKISLDQIAANMYLSPYYISRIFKSETGDTPINYLISLRMEHARDLMDAHPEMSIQSVASQVGYEDAYHFSKQFKKYFGLSPLYYKGRARM
ncbi:MAG TPA: helix-turn-helix transcriptional regulator [Candidatus Pullilachnospira intestinigallinarum]|nr:helix-turn-helix transcriptional regulator [Candidatus Pullilachnospira intestinigallinarum]